MVFFFFFHFLNEIEGTMKKKRTLSYISLKSIPFERDCMVGAQTDIHAYILTYILNTTAIEVT